MTNNKVLGLDLGGSSIKWGIVDEQGKMHEQGRQPLEDRTAKRVTGYLREIMGTALTHEPGILAVGMGSPGLLNADRKIVRYSPNFPEWKDIPLYEQLIDSTHDRPLVLENDANLLVFSETRWGAAQGKKDVIVLTLGTGVGGGVLVNGQLLTGSHGGAAELGFVTVDPNGPEYSVNRGCLESFCNIEGVLRTAREVYGSEPTPASPSDLAKAADGGDERAIEVWRRTGTALGIGLASLINIFNPECILIGGGLSGASEWILPAAREEAGRRSHGENFNEVEIMKAGLGAESGLMGAAALAFAKIAVQ